MIALVLVALAVGFSVALVSLALGDLLVLLTAPLAASATMLACAVGLALGRGWPSAATTDREPQLAFDLVHDELVERLRVAAGDLTRAQSGGAAGSNGSPANAAAGAPRGRISDAA